MAKKSKEIPYSEAIGELEQILARLRSGQLGISELTASVKRAKELIAICRSQLVATREELEKIINDNTTL